MLKVSRQHASFLIQQGINGRSHFGRYGSGVGRTVEGEREANHMTRSIAHVLCVAAVVVLAGCEAIGTAAQSKTNQGALLGSALGAGTGAIIGNQTGHAGAGTAIGAGLGALGGGLLGHGLQERDTAVQRQQFPAASSVPYTPSSTGTVAPTGRQKYCPVGGEIFAENVKYCPNHGVELQYRN